MERDSSQRSTTTPMDTAAPSVEVQPVIAAEASAPSAPEPEPRAAQSTLRLAVFEDSYSTLRLVMRTFKHQGHEVDHFANLDNASQAIASGRYDALIVSDTMMGGAEACQGVIARVRSGPDTATAAIPILALTLRDDASRRRVLELLGASATLSEPTDARLVAALSAAIDHGTTAVPALHGKPRVLLLEDSYSLSLLLSDGLVRGGRAVEHFATPDHIIEALDEGDYEALVFSQNDLPGQVSCVQLIEHALVMGQAGAAKPRIFVLTDNMAPDNVNALLRAGAERVLHKRNSAQLGNLILSLLDIKPSTPSAMAEIDDTLVAPVAGDAPPRSPTRSSLPYIAALAALGLLAGGGFAWQQYGVKPRVNVVNAELDTVARIISAGGNVVSKRQVELAPALTGQLYHVYANEGDLVRKGETLATLDNREATINVRRAEAQVFRYRTELNLANKALDALRAQAGPDSSPQALLDLEKDRALAVAKLRETEQELSAAKLALDRLSVVAPFAGVLLQSFAIEGKWVEAGVPVFTLSDLDAREVVLRIDSDAAGEIAAGQKVQMTADGALGEEWEEKVLRVVADSRGSDWTAMGPSALVYASLGEDAPLLQFGRRVNAQIIADTVDNAVTVPLEALTTRDDKHYVALVNDQRIAFRPVEVGLRSLSKAEIRVGLVPGESVALSAAGLRDGQRVDVAEVD